MRRGMRKLGDFGRAMRRMHELDRDAGDTRDGLLALQRRRLLETVRHAATSSAVYRELYDGIELSDDLDLRALPATSKPLLMERFDEWVTDSRLRLADVESHLEQVTGDDLYLGQYRAMPTGGTTGRKGIFVYDRSEWQECLVAFMRWSALMGMKPRLGRRVRTATVGATSPLHMTARFGMSIDLGLYRMLRADAREPLPKLVAALNAHSPERLIGYPSILSLLAVEQLEGRLSIAPTMVATTSEVRTDEMTANIRAAWSCDPFDIYGTTESFYAGDCAEHAGMHVFEDLGMVEVVDEQSAPVPDGKPGAKLLITSFIKRTQPLIRYEISDLVALTTEPCRCGRPLARFASVEGRSDDILRLAGAGGALIAVHPLALRSPMAGLPEVRQYKIVHDESGIHVQVALRAGVVADAAATRISDTLTFKLRELGCTQPAVDVDVVDTIARDGGHGAKFKLIESRVSRGA